MEPFNPPDSIPRGQRTYINEHHQLVVWPGWLTLLNRNQTATDNNLKRALSWCKDDWDRQEIQSELDRRSAKRKVQATVKTEKTIENAHPILQLFVNRMPKRPMFADVLDHGTKVRPRLESIRHKEVQVNLPWARQCLVFDLDHTDALDTKLPPPNIVVKNSVNGHRHAFIVWKTPVLVGPNASQKAQKYYTDIATAVGQCWQADPNYTGTLAHNPLYNHWKTEILQPEPYELADFKQALQIVRSMPANHPRLRTSEWAENYAAQGRNCRTWEACRWPSYALGTGATVDVVMELVQSFDAMHNSPLLGYRECLTIAKSISRYTLSGNRQNCAMTHDDWQRYVDHTHRPEVQSERGKRSGEVRRAKSEDKRIIAQGMADQGYKLVTIAKQLDVNRSTVHRWLRS